MSIDFNSIKVRLKPSRQSSQHFARCHFNSIKVRLKQKADGTPIAYVVFQFHKGTIKTSVFMIIAISKTNFNSIKVRLKHEGADGVKGRPFLFQFHKGTIKTV